MLYVSEIRQITRYNRIAIVTDTDTGEEVGRLTFGDSVSNERVRWIAPLLITNKNKKGKSK